MYKFIKEEYEVLNSPLTVDQAKPCDTGDYDRYFEGVVSVSLCDIADSLDSDELLTLLSTILIGEDSLRAMDYEIVGVEGKQNVLLKISGYIDNED